MKLAGYLRNGALPVVEFVEWRGSLNALQVGLDPGNQILAALDFHHAVQRDSEFVAT